MRTIWILLQRELRDTLRSPALLASMISLPITVVVVPLVLVVYLDRAAPEATRAAIQQLYELKAEDPTELLVEAVAFAWLPIFLLMPVFVPILLSAQSVGGERERKTLEPLLATPVSTTQIVLAKSLASVVPAVLLCWLSAAVFIGGLDWVAYRGNGSLPLPDLPWAVGVLVLGPLLSIFGNAVAVAISARVRDPRAAQNLAAMTVMPVIGLGITQIAGGVRLGIGFYVVATVVLVALDVGLVYLAAALFDRERLLR
ncbi:MAG: ABC transporter permease subunit [Deltaproteobacteria bacterium]|nr:ABC transporter permease subunit [Deltaproteobacteria bacterium]